MSDLYGTLDSSKHEWDETGFHLTLILDTGEKVSVRVDMNAGRALISDLGSMQDWIDEHDRELAAYRRACPDERAAVTGREPPACGYDPSDPKHLTYYERMVG